jgi:hypothetical protein
MVGARIPVSGDDLSSTVGIPNASGFAQVMLTDFE